MKPGGPASDLTCRIQRAISRLEEKLAELALSYIDAAERVPPVTVSMTYGYELGVREALAPIKALVDRWETEASSRGPEDMLCTTGVVSMLRHAMRETETDE